MAKLEFNLLETLASDDVCRLTAIPGGERPIDIPSAELIRQLMLGNQALVGSVNAHTITSKWQSQIWRLPPGTGLATSPI